MIPESLDLPSRLEHIRHLFPPEARVYLVGGAVRDALLRKSIHDMDFVVERNAMAAARHVADSLKVAYYPLDVERDTGRVVAVQPDGSRQVMDFALIQGADIQSDLLARDFTINAMAIDLRHPENIIDPLGGALDLRERQLRACSATAFDDDPVRILRGMRLASSLDLRMQPETLRLLRQAVPGLERISPERIRDELFRILESPKLGASLRIMDTLGVLAMVLPELPALKGVIQPAPHVFDAWEHTINTVQKLDVIWKVLDIQYHPDAAANLAMGLISLRLGRYREQIHSYYSAWLNPNRSLRALVTLAALYHDAAKPNTRSQNEYGEIHYYDHDQAGARLARIRTTDLRLSNEEIDRLETIVRYHMRPLLLGQAGRLPSRRAIYRFFRDAGPAGVDVCLLSLADFLATYGLTVNQDAWLHHLDVVHTLLDAWWDHPSEFVSPPHLMNGKLLMERLDLSPGPQIGKILEAVREAQASGQVSSLEQALELAESILNQED